MLWQIVSQINLKNELSYEVGFLKVVRDPLMLQTCSIISSESGQAYPMGLNAVG